MAALNPLEDESNNEQEERTLKLLAMDVGSSLHRCRLNDSTPES